jgi:hypothetical protein
MTVAMQGSIKRWTAKRMMAHVVEIIEGKTEVAEAVQVAPRALDLHSARDRGMPAQPFRTVGGIERSGLGSTPTVD